MIKKLFVRFIVVLGKSWSYIYSYKLNRKLSNIKIILYSAWISREFKSFGVRSRIYSVSSLVGGKYISIGERSLLGTRTVLTAWDKYGSDLFTPQIFIGDNVNIGDDCHITAINSIKIGNNVLTGKKITITDSAHGKNDFEFLSIPPAERPLYSAGPVIIDDAVWIGDKVTILANVHIGKNAIIGANAVVTKDIPANCVAGGIPARILKQL
jgi:acetyltransferase-like isoleucine patch superfamily enzyme